MSVNCGNVELPTRRRPVAVCAMKILLDCDGPFFLLSAPMTTTAQHLVLIEISIVMHRERFNEIRKRKIKVKIGRKNRGENFKNYKNLRRFRNLNQKLSKKFLKVLFKIPKKSDEAVTEFFIFK